MAMHFETPGSEVAFEIPNEWWHFAEMDTFTGGRFLSNTDQGRQFTSSAAFTGMLAAAEIQISMDGRGRWMDKFLSNGSGARSKYKDGDLKGYADGREAKAGIGSWIAF